MPQPRYFDTIPTHERELAKKALLQPGVLLGLVMLVRAALGLFRVI